MKAWFQFLAGLLAALPPIVVFAGESGSPIHPWREPPVLSRMQAQTQPSGALPVFLQGRPWSGEMLARTPAPADDFKEEAAPPAMKGWWRGRERGILKPW